VALNKIDRLYGWEATPNNSVLDSLEKQKESVRREYEDRVRQTIVAFAEQGLNAELFYRNNDVRRVVSLVPTSAITGEGIPDLLALLVQLTQKMLGDVLMYNTEVEATVLEVRAPACLGGWGERGRRRTAGSRAMRVFVLSGRSSRSR